MRVTDRLMFERSSRDLARARTALDAAQQAVSSGRRVNHPGDDPAVAGAIAAFGISAQRSEALSRTTASAADELGAADVSLERVGNALSRARELAVRFANDTYTADQRAMGAVEAKGLLADTVAALNSRYANRYVFGGFKDDAPPFGAAGNYLGDSGVRQVEIAPGVFQPTSVRADVAIKGAAPGGVDVTGALAALEAALSANDLAGLQATLDVLDQSMSQIAAARAEVGVSMNALDTANAAAKLASEEEKAALVRLSETDVVEGSLRLAQAQNALEVSMAATAQGLRLSLLDYLR